VLTVKWKENAVADFITIIDYIEQFNPIAAEHIRELIENAAAQLSLNPYAYKRSYRFEGARELVAHPNYIIFYSISDTAVEILAVVHAKRDYP
jgi:toxin ParE1/3/4